MRTSAKIAYINSQRSGKGYGVYTGLGGYVPSFPDRLPENGWSTTLILQRLGFDTSNLPDFPSSPPPAGKIWVITPQGYKLGNYTDLAPILSSMFYDPTINAVFTNGGNIGGAWKGNLDILPAIPPPPPGGGIIVPTGQVGNTIWGQTPAPPPASQVVTGLRTDLPVIAASNIPANNNQSSGSSATNSQGKAMLNFGFTGYTVGSRWTVSITGANPNSQVTASATQNGKDLGTSVEGVTDANGNFTSSGIFDTTTIGTWNEIWYVGGQEVGRGSFTVTVAQSQQTVNNPTGSMASTTINTTNTTTNPVTTQDMTGGPNLSFLSEGLNIGGVTIPFWLIGVGVVVFMMNSEGGRRR